MSCFCVFSLRCKYLLYSLTKQICVFPWGFVHVRLHMKNTPAARPVRLPAQLRLPLYTLRINTPNQILWRRQHLEPVDCLEMQLVNSHQSTVSSNCHSAEVQLSPGREVFPGWITHVSFLWEFSPCLLQSFPWRRMSTYIPATHSHLQKPFMGNCLVVFLSHFLCGPTLPPMLGEGRTHFTAQWTTWSGHHSLL